MIRVLHLSTASPDFQTQRCLELLRNPGEGFSTDLRQFRGDGLLAAVTATRFIRQVCPDIIHAWGNTALWSAIMAGAKKIVFSPIQEAPAPISWLNSRIHAVSPTHSQRLALISAGWLTANYAVIPPAVDFQRLIPRNAGLRAALGFAESDYVILSPGESTSAAAHRVAVWTTSMPNILDERNRLLLWGRGPKTESAMRFAKTFRRQSLLTIAEQKLGSSIEFEELLGAADAILIPAAGSSTAQAIAISMATGLPIIAAHTPITAEFLEDNVTGILVSDATAKTLAERILEIKSDPATAARLGAAARKKAAELFTIPQTMQMWQAIYSAANQSV